MAYVRALSHPPARSRFGTLARRSRSTPCQQHMAWMSSRRRHGGLLRLPLLGWRTSLPQVPLLAIDTGVEVYKRALSLGSWDGSIRLWQVAENKRSFELLAEISVVFATQPRRT